MKGVLAVVLSALVMNAVLVSQGMAESKDPVFLLSADESLLHISATETRKVAQDLLIATLSIEAEDTSNKVVQNKINTAMAAALKAAKPYQKVKAITQGYRVHQFDRNAGRKERTRDMAWKGKQSVMLKSKDAKELLELAGKIQESGFVMVGLNYTLSPEVAAEVQDEMLEEALEKLTSRAQRAAMALGKSDAQLKEINATDDYAPRQPARNRGIMMASMAADSEMAAPVASPDETTITMRVKAKALLK